MAFPHLFTKEIAENFTRENFRRIQKYFNISPFALGEFAFFEIPVTSAVTNFVYPHHLGFQPKDVILMHNLTNTAVTFHYDKFDATNIVFTTGATTTLRALIGRYENG